MAGPAKSMNSSPAENVQQMLKNDAFSQWLGIEILQLDAGYCRLKMQVRQEMLNGFGIAHGGICFALADTCLAFAANTYGRISLTLKADISWPEPAKERDVLLAESSEMSLSEKSAVYDVHIRRESDGKTMALFRGLVHRTNKIVLENQ
jgi:acyl-CoA thioesterase